MRATRTRTPRPPSETYLSPEARRALLHRLNRAVGQMEALRERIEGGACVDDLIVLALAGRQALTQVIARLLEDHLVDCATTCMDGGREEILRRVSRVVTTVLRNA